ncbi:hypothetical protein NQ314_016143 [Rhamnusium bicolor]|uniref:GCN5-related N-acetyltransferase Rv2170-like domain-containing protein n=1 Tax=Rhamnusium bicolor TaxID=1586634 RepID=A0AAV8WWL3_9CUCU|nr:hypothetical protein NQ314_016143 [Rhamnusium bicolor]
MSECHNEILMNIPDEDLEQLADMCPEEVEIRKLDTSHSNTVNLPWPQKFPNSEEYVSSLIETNEGYGLFLKSTDELVSWVVKTGLGQLGIVQTEKDHTKKGYACIVTKLLSKKIAEEDENPTGTIAVTNIASQNMFRKLGFEKKGMCNYITLEKMNCCYIIK